jgi:hypothetical protein
MIGGIMVSWDKSTNAEGYLVYVNHILWRVIMGGDTTSIRYNGPWTPKPAGFNLDVSTEEIANSSAIGVDWKYKD